MACPLSIGVPVALCSPGVSRERHRLRTTCVSVLPTRVAGSWLRGTAIPKRCVSAQRPSTARSTSRSPQCCWSLEVSLATSAFVAATTAKLVHRNGPRDRGNAVFLGIFGSMQLIDAMLWWEQSGGVGLEECSVFNRIVSRLAIGIILLEPIAALIGTSMIAKKKPSAFEALLYAMLFLLTPMAGTTYYPTAGNQLVPCEVVSRGPCQPGVGAGWGSLLMDLKSPSVCSTETPTGHLRYGGMDILYHSLLTPMDDINISMVNSGGGTAAVRGSEEIPMVLRLFFLLSMAVPYAIKVKPRSCGLTHAAVLLATWMYGATSDAHASMWCVANVLQGAIMLADPILWPSPGAQETAPSIKGGQSHSAAAGMGPRVHSTTAAISSAPISVARQHRMGHTVEYSKAPPSAGTFNTGRHLAKERRSARRSAVRTKALPNDTPADGSSGGLPKKEEKVRPKQLAKIYRKQHVPESIDAIVIGSGIGGLSCASLLSKAGKRVLVLEKHYRPGGCTHAFTEIGDNAFDSGIHYVGGGPVMTSLLSYVVSEPLELAQMGSEADGYLYDRFDLGGGPENMIDFCAGREALVEDLIVRYPSEADGIRRYMKAVEGAANGTNALMLTKLLPYKMPGRLAVSNFLARIAQGYARRTAQEVVNDFVTDPELRALLAAGQMIDWNLAPDKVSWLVSAGMMNYYADGGFYPTGGSNKIPESIIPIIQKTGGAVLCKAAVEKIIVDEITGVAKGVRMANGDEIEAPMVVSSAGYHNTFEKFLTPSELGKVGLDLTKGPSASLEPSHGHVCAFISLDGPPEAFNLGPWNIHSMPELPRYRHNISQMQKEFYADPLNAQKECLMTLTCPAAKDPLYSKQFPGRSNVLLLVEGLHEWFAHLSDAQANASTHGRRSPDYKQLKEQFQEMFLDRLYKYYPLTRGHVTNVELSTPLTAEHFLNAPKGASYGLEWTPGHFDPKMHEDWLNPTTKIPGLYLTGEAACFGGFYGALATGYATASRVLGVLPLLWLLLRDKPISPKDVTPKKRSPPARRSLDHVPTGLAGPGLHPVRNV